jgi:hypothetical protein
MCVSDEVLYVLLQDFNECNDISESEYSNDSEINVNISSCGEQCQSEEDKTVSDKSSMQHGICAKSDAEQPHLPLASLA